MVFNYRQVNLLMLLEIGELVLQYGKAVNVRIKKILKLIHVI